MYAPAAALIAELEAETAATRRVLERIPDEHLGWRPHPKSMSLGQLAQHVAGIPGAAARLSTMEMFDVATRGTDYVAAESRQALLETLDGAVAAMREALAGLDETRAQQPFRMAFGDQTLASFPRIGVLRTIGLNHWYHHRGELVVYLRLLDVPVPVVYGRSADEGPGVRAAA